MNSEANTLCIEIIWKESLEKQAKYSMKNGEYGQRPFDWIQVFGFSLELNMDDGG